MTDQTLTLEDKLARISKSLTASPEVSRQILTDFCRLPILPVLDEMFSFQLRRNLIAFCRDNRIAMNVPLTFGRTAEIIADRFLHKPGEPRVNVRPVLNAYLSPLDEASAFELSYRSHHREPAPAQEIPGHLLPFFDLLNLPLGDLLSVTKGRELPTRVLIYQARCRETYGYTDDLRLMALFCELKGDVLSDHDDDLEISYSHQYDVSDIHADVGELRGFIEFFVEPIAALSRRLRASQTPGCEPEQLSIVPPGGRSPKAMAS